MTSQRAGASRVELCASMPEGGTTPSGGLISVVRKALEIGIFVMIRPRGGDFLYNESELQTMQYDIDMAKNLGADGIVLGILNKNGQVNKTQVAKFVAQAYPLEVTFHRAIDCAVNYDEALEAIIDTGCKRILTSGQANTAFEGINNLEKIVKQAKNRIEIMAGSGVNAINAASLLKIGVDSLHLSAKAIRNSEMIFRNDKIKMGGFGEMSEFEIAFADEQKIRDVKNVMEMFD